MSDMGDMLKEFLVGDEMFDESKGKRSFDEVMDKFKRRGRTQRIVYWIDSLLMLALVIYSAVKFFAIESELATADHILYAVLFMTGIAGITMLKIWLLNAHYQLEMMKSQKRTEYRLLDELKQQTK